MMHALRRGLDFVTGALCCVLLAGMVAVLSWQVFSRYALGTPSTFSEETLRFGAVWLSLLGAAYSAGRGTHMAVDLLRDRTRGRLRQALELLVPVAFIVFAVVVLIVGGLRAVEIAQSQYTAVMRLPMGAVYAALPASGALIVLYSILNLIDLLRGERHEAPELEKIVSAGD
jgi:TRAP-type C4-dicarboxylate transport system permease small subunit